MVKTAKKVDWFPVKNIWVIGVGGVGGILVHYLWKMFNRKGVTLHLIDGDNYTLSNLDRQYFNSFGNKADVTMKHIQSQPATFLKIKAYPYYYLGGLVTKTFQPGSIVICAADNHWARYKVQLECKGLQNVIFFSGGNEYTDGNVQFFVHKDGTRICGDYLETYHPEFKVDKIGPQPNFSGSCDKKSDPQLLVTNLNVATIILNTLTSILDDKLPKYSEVYFDVLKNTSKPIERNK